MSTLTRGRVRAALGLAMIADVVQIGLVPLFGWGALFWPNDALDIVVAAALLMLLGWHWAFLPSFVAEMVPALNLFPTWTTAVLFATRGASAGVRADLPPAPVVPAAALEGDEARLGDEATTAADGAEDVRHP
jgi:hypothetical protein